MILFPKARRRLSKLRRSPKIFVPISSERQLVIPFRPLSLLLIVSLFASTVYFFLRSDTFQIKNLSFEFEELADEALVRQRISEEVLGRSTVFLDAGAVEGKIKREFPTVRAIEIKKALPDRVHICVSVRVPLAKVRVENGDMFLVDADGYLFRKASDENLPIIDLGESFVGKVGEVVGGDEVRAYLETLDCVGGKGLEAASVALKPGEIELKLESGPSVLLSVAKSVYDQVEILAQLLKRYKFLGRTPVGVDLRFSRPVVRF